MRVDQQRWLEAEVERLGPLEAIVRALASSDPICDRGGNEDNDYVCAVCPDDWVDDWRWHPEDVIHHDDCVWVRAKAWVEANPT